MTGDEARALLRSLPIWRFDAVVLTGFGFPQEHAAQFAGFDGDGRALIEFNTEADITPLRVVHEYGHALRAKYMGSVNQIPAFWKTLAQNSLWALPTWGDPYDEAFAQSVSWLWTPGSPVPLSSVFRSTASSDQVRGYVESLLPASGGTAVRTMYDSTNPLDIPTDAQMVAGYIDGIYRWPDGSWDRFPNAVKIRIAIKVTTNDGHVGDVEWGDMTNEQAPVWVHMRRAAGADPTIYCSESNWPACRQAFIDAGEPEPHWWLAHYHVAPVIPDGAVAYQYANELDTGAHYDLSVVIDGWPKGESPVTDDEFLEKYNRLVQPGITATDEAIKARLAIDAHHAHATSEPIEKGTP